MAAGLKDVSDLLGGFSAWAAPGLPIERKDQPVKSP